MYARQNVPGCEVSFFLPPHFPFSLSYHPRDIEFHLFFSKLPSTFPPQEFWTRYFVSAKYSLHSSKPLVLSTHASPTKTHSSDHMFTYMLQIYSRHSLELTENTTSFISTIYYPNTLPFVFIEFIIIPDIFLTHVLVYIYFMYGFCMIKESRK